MQIEVSTAYQGAAIGGGDGVERFLLDIGRDKGVDWITGLLGVVHGRSHDRLWWLESPMVSVFVAWVGCRGNVRFRGDFESSGRDPAGEGFDFGLFDRLDAHFHEPISRRHARVTPRLAGFSPAPSSACSPTPPRSEGTPGSS